MIRGEFSDGDAFGEAMAQLARAAEEKRATPVEITTGVRDDFLAALSASNEFLDRFTGPKKPHGERVPALQLVAKNAALIKKLEESAPVAKRAGRRAQSRARKASD